MRFKMLDDKNLEVMNNFLDRGVVQGKSGISIKNCQSRGINILHTMKKC